MYNFYYQKQLKYGAFQGEGVKRVSHIWVLSLLIPHNMSITSRVIFMFIIIELCYAFSFVNPLATITNK